MNNSELGELLRRVRVPERKPEEWQALGTDTMRAVYCSLSVHRKGVGQRHEVLPRQPHFRTIGLWISGCAAACVLAGFIFGHWYAQQEARRNEIAHARKLFSELSALFPNQIEAVIFDEQGPRLVLAERPIPGSNPPIFLRICAERRCERVVTFSGRRVSMSGESWEVLVDAHGNVIVAGEHFVWSSGQRATGAHRLQIEAAQLSAL